MFDQGAQRGDGLIGRGGVQTGRGVGSDADRQRIGLIGLAPLP
jgi:hypothetical protein